MSDCTRRALGTACALVFSFQLHAAPGDDAIVVTATRFPERALSAPIGMRIISAEDIENSTASTVPEVLDKLGGIHVRTSTNSPDLQLDMRGFGATGDDNVAVLLDGVRIDRIEQNTYGLSGIPLQMVERIEILPGGGAVQYGAGAVGGTINIITKKPRAGERSGSVFGSLGDFNARETRASAAVAGEEIGMMVGVSRSNSDSYRDNNDIEQTSALASLRWNRGPHRAGLTWGLDEQELNLPGPRSREALRSDRDGTGTPLDNSSRDGSYAILSGGTRVGAVELEMDAAHREGFSRAFFDDGFGFVFRPKSEHRSDSLSPRARWTAELAGMPLQLIGGYDYAAWTMDNHSVGSFLGSPFLPSFNNGEAEQRSNAYYAQVLAELRPGTRLNVGVRAQRLHQEQRNLSTLVDEKRNLYANEIALRQAFGDALSAHIKYGRSFRVPNADENNGFGLTGDVLKPQRAKQREIGVQYRDAGIRAAATAYEMRLEDEIGLMAITSPGFFFANTNLEPTRRRGVETSLDWYASRKVEMGLSWNFVRATFRHGTYGGVDVSDNEIPLVPRHLANARLVWEFMPQTKMALHYNFVGKQRYENDQANEFEKMPSYATVDLRLARRQGDWLLRADVNNLFDNEYYTYGVVNFTYTSFNAYPQPGRTLTVSAEYRFD